VFSLNKDGSLTEIETIDIKAYSRKAAKQKETTKRKNSTSQNPWGPVK